MILDLIALVDLQRGGREFLPGHIGRADILAAVALDAGEGIHDMRLRQVGDALDAELLDLFIFEIQRSHLAE